MDTPPYIYLDLCHWIALLQAETGQNDQRRYSPALNKLNHLVDSGRVIVPLSGEHLMEVAKIGHPEQREPLARLMVRLSRGWFLKDCRRALIPELKRAVARQYGREANDEPFAPLTKRISEAFPQQAYNNIHAELADLLYSNPGRLEKLLATSRVTSHFVNNWAIFAERHEHGRDLCKDVSRIVRKRAYCVQVMRSVQEDVISVLAEFGIEWKDLRISRPEQAVAFLEAIPTLNVEISLFTERNEHRDRAIADNDEIDISYLSRAIPTCDIVATEKFWSTLANRLGLSEQYGTRVGHNLNELLADVIAA